MGYCKRMSTSVVGVYVADITSCRCRSHAICTR